MIERHHLILVRSEISPQFGISPFGIKISWNELDAMTTEEQAQLNKIKAEAGQILVNSGAIDGQEERNRLMADPKSGYTGLEELAPEDDLEIPDDMTGG